MTVTPEALEALNQKAFQSGWGHGDVLNLAATLVDLYRTGQLVLIDDQAVERVARKMCLELGRMGDTEAVERNRVEADWPRYVNYAQAAITALRTKP